MAAQGAIIVMLVFLSSCAIDPRTKEQSRQIADQVHTGVQQSKSAQSSSDRELIIESTESYLGLRRPIQVTQIAPATLPGLEQRVDITFAEPVNMGDLARVLSAQTGITIKVDPEITPLLIKHVDWSGTARAALDSITGQLGYSWRIRGKGAEVYHTTLKSWIIYAPSVTSRWQATVGLSGSVQGGSGGSDLQAQDQVVINMDTGEFWNQLEATVNGLLSAAGRATLNRQSGELSVVDTPSALERIDEWVTAKNQEIATQVSVSIDLYEVEHSAEAISGYNLEGVLKEVFGSDAGTVEFSSDDTGSLLGLKFTHSESKITEASDLAVILRDAVDGAQVSKLTSTVLRTMNGQPVPVFFGDETSYLQRRDVVNDEGLTTVRLVPGKLQDGIALNLIPRVLPDTNRLMLNITVRTTRIKGISRFPADAGPKDPVIQLPDLESRSMLLPVMLRSGETLFVAGLDTARSTERNAQGILSMEERSENRRATLVLLITPHIIVPPLEMSGYSHKRSN